MVPEDEIDVIKLRNMSTVSDSKRALSIQSESESFQVIKSFFKRKQNKGVRHEKFQTFESPNFFSILEVEDPDIQEDDRFDDMNKENRLLNKSKPKAYKTNSLSINKKKVKDNMNIISPNIQKLEDDNQILITSENKGEAVSQKLEGLFYLGLPRRQLKRCRFCHFKKRSYSLNPHSCKAKTLQCYSCFRIGNCHTRTQVTISDHLYPHLR